MKKEFSIIAICITSIFVCFMIKINSETKVDNTVIQYQKKESINKNDSYNQEKVKNEEKSIKNKDDDNHESEETKKVDKEEIINENTENKNIKKQDEDIDNTDETEEKTATVFKVDKKTIASKVSFEDKAKLLIYSRKLSTADEAQIKELMKSSDELNSSIKIFKILKLRLDTKDYNSVKIILSPYIDVNLIEKNLK